MKFFGTRPTYQLFSAATFITGCFYYLFNQFYIRKRAMGDENDLCKKKPVILDAEKREKINPTIDVATENEVNTIETSKATIPQIKLVSDSIDGSSDSGVDNPAYNDNVETTMNDKKNDDKTKV